MKKFIAIFILGSALVGLLLFWQGRKAINEKIPLGDEKTRPTEELIYKNQQHHLSFRYPSDWQLEEIADEPQFLSLILKKEDEGQEKVLVPGGEKAVPVYSISVRVNNNPQQLSAMDYYLNQFASGSRAQAEEKIEKLTLSGRPAIKYLEGAAPASGPSTMVLVAKGDKIYSFSYSALAQKETHEKFLDQFNLLLATVKIFD